MTDTEPTQPIAELLIEPIVDAMDPTDGPDLLAKAPVTFEALEHIHTWRQRLSDQTVVSASEVQNRLFDLYGDLEPLPQLDRLKPWLSLTVQRELFSATELDAFLDELSMELRGAEPA
jgi:hypothetical protein